MQRIKSQSAYNPHANPSQSRPRSKKTPKPQSTQLTYHIAQKIKNPATEHSMISAKSSSKILSGSMKNLRVDRHQQSVSKGSVQNTARAGAAGHGAGQGTAISARILKEIVGYTHRGGNRQKGSSKDAMLGDKDEPTIKIDLTQEMENLYTRVDRDLDGDRDKEDMQLRTTLSNNRNKSQQMSENKEKDTGNSSSNRHRHTKNQHRVVQQFSPLNLSPEKQQKQQKKQMKKRTFFDGTTQQQLITNTSQLHNVSQATIAQHIRDNELSQINFETWKNYSSFNQIQDQDRNEKTSNLIKMASPLHLLGSLQKSSLSQAQKFNCGRVQKQNKRQNCEIDSKIITSDLKAIQTQSKNGNPAQDNQLMEQKQRLIICLQQSNALLQQHYQFQFKQLIPYWTQILDTESTLSTLSQTLLSLQSSLTQTQLLSLHKKTQLFELTREQLNRRKQRDYQTRSNKERYIGEAVACQEGLRMKLSSRADYQHVVLFNQRVVLSGGCGEDLVGVFGEMFQGRLAKKFALIAKKQLANLSVYDARLIQDFLKRIQQLQTSYSKTQPPSSHHQSLSILQSPQLQSLVQQIQQLTLTQQNLSHKLSTLQAQRAQLQGRIGQLNAIIEEEIGNINRRVSGEYRIVEGRSFDFQGLLMQRFMGEFQGYRREVEYRDGVLGKLRDIERLIGLKNADKDRDRKGSHLQEYRSNSQDNNSRVHENKRKSISILQTPNRTPLKLDKSPDDSTQRLFKN